MLLLLLLFLTAKNQRITVKTPFCFYIVLIHFPLASTSGSKNIYCFPPPHTHTHRHARARVAGVSRRCSYRFVVSDVSHEEFGMKCSDDDLDKKEDTQCGMNGAKELESDRLELYDVIGHCCIVQYFRQDTMDIEKH